MGISQALWGDRRMGVYGWRAVKDRGLDDSFDISQRSLHCLANSIGFGFT